jgi:nitrate/TMAO reductase-like tetraheme cytochrome c subunit
MKIGKYLITVFIAMFVVAGVAAFMFGYQIAGSTEANKQAGFCINCHEMRPSYYTWKVTSHNKFGCLKCHTDIKWGSFIYKHWKSAIANPVEKNGIIPDGVCRSCHAPSQRNISPPGDVIFPHELHVVKQIDCVDCHNNVAHLLASDYIKKEYSDKQKTFDPAAFDEKQAKQLIKKGNQILMPVCMRCHNGEMATEACKDCHSSIKATEKIAVTE